MFKKIAFVMLFVCDFLLAWGLGYFICLFAAPVGSAYIAGGFRATGDMSNLDLMILLGVSYLCYAAFLVIGEVVVVQFCHRKLKAFIERVKSDSGNKERKLFNKVSRKNCK